jgi:hypothetical protein
LAPSPVAPGKAGDPDKFGPEPSCPGKPVILTSLAPSPVAPGKAGDPDKFGPEPSCPGKPVILTSCPKPVRSKEGAWET